MSKFLRQIEFRGFLRDAIHDETDANWLDFFECHPNYLTGLWALVRHALPVRCGNVSKINLYGCKIERALCDDPCLGIASLWVDIGTDCEDALVSCNEQQAFMVNLAHRGLSVASQQLGFDFEPFQEATSFAVDNDFRYEYQIGRTIASPNRQHTAETWCYFDNGFKSELVLRRKQGDIEKRMLFGLATEQTISKLTWVDSENLRISTKGFHDSYWMCSLNGDVEFKYGLADSKSAHHIYRHACILLDGVGVLQDIARGTELLENAAALGYKHAQRRLQNT